MIMPDVLIVENYRTMSRIGLIDTIPAIALPYVASAFGIFLLRQTFKTVPKELDDAARVEGASPLQVLLKVYVPLARPIYVAYGLVSVSYHWNNFLWPLIVTNSVEARPLTVGLQVFSSGDQGVDWADHLRRDLDDIGPPAGRLPAVPAPVRAKFYARGDTLTGEFIHTSNAVGLQLPAAVAGLGLLKNNRCSCTISTRSAGLRRWRHMSLAIFL